MSHCGRTPDPTCSCPACCTARVTASMERDADDEDCLAASNAQRDCGCYYDQACTDCVGVAQIADPLRAEIASLRAALAAERKAHERQTAAWAESGREKAVALARVSEALGEGEYDCSVTLLDVHERVRAKVMSLKATAATAIADRIAAEKERDAFRTQAEASLVVPCACGRPMPSVSSRLRCDACRAEGERDEARAQTAAFRAVLSDIAEDYGVPYDNQQCDAPKRATEALEASDAGAPLLAELRALRAVRDAAEAAAVCHDRMRCFGLSGFPRDGYVCPGCRLRAALDAAKVGG